MVGPVHYLVLAAALFALGAAGVVIRRNAIIVLMSIELMLNAVNLTFLTFSRFPLVVHSSTAPIQGHAAVFYVIAVAAAEAAVGLAIVIAIFRSRLTVNVDEIESLKL